VHRSSTWRLSTGFGFSTGLSTGSVLGCLGLTGVLLGAVTRNSTGGRTQDCGSLRTQAGTGRSQAFRICLRTVLGTSEAALGDAY
jgi:hypothetical protein